MEIRHLAVFLSGAVALRGGPAAPVIKTYPLDARVVYAVGVGTDEPTTCLFPGPLTAIEAANLSAKPEDRPPVLLSYQPGARFFSVRALRADAHAAVNVVFRERIFVFDFAATAEPDRAVTFVEEAPPVVAPAPRTATPAVLRDLLERARHFALLQEQYPALASAIGHATPETTSDQKGFTVTIEDVFRFDPEDTLVFRLRFANGGSAPVRYEPKNIAVRVGRELCVAALADASGVIPAQGITEGFVAIVGGPDSGRADFSVRNAFSILVSRAA